MRRTATMLVALLLALLPPFAHAQIASGNLYGTVTTQTGSVLPGVEVTLSGAAETRETVSGPDGRFRLLELGRGRYVLRLSLKGFATLEREVRIVSGETVELSLTMALSSLEEAVVVTAETPLVDTRSQGTSTTMTAEELDHIPTPRDPWGLMRNVPGVLTDRVNIAGNESGQQSQFVGKGSSEDNTWTMDGLPISDMTDPSAPATYFEFGAIDEIEVSTGGSDLRVAGGGVGVHLTVKRGTNVFHGAARFLLAHDALSSGNLPDELQGDSRLEGSDQADHIRQISDYGFELGGPILKDRLWFYGSWGGQDIRLRDITQTDDRTVIDGWNAKLNWQASSRTMVSGSWFLVRKLKFGRRPPFSGVVADSYRWDQKNYHSEGGMPPGLWKLQVDHTLSPNLFLSARIAHFDTGWGLDPRGPGDQSYTRDFFRGEAIGTFIAHRSLDPHTTVSIDGSGFIETLGGSHELKFGFGYRTMTSSNLTSYSGNQIAGEIYAPDDTVAVVLRDSAWNFGGQYWSAYLGDVFTRGRLTVNLGLRWDRQGGRNLPADVAGNPALPELLPALSYPGDTEDLVSWNDLSPRVGLSLALDEGRRTVLRASYADYAQQLPLWQVTDENSSWGGQLAYGWHDANGDRFVQSHELLLDQFLYSYNVDPTRPGEAVDPVSKVDRELRARRDRELVVGLERELAPSLAAGVAYTWRSGRHFRYWPYLGGACEGEPTAQSCPVPGPETYTANAPETANGYTAFTYSPDPGLRLAGGFGWIATNRPGYSQSYNGLELTLTKRLSRGWMGRVAFSLNDWVEHFEGTPVGTLPASPGATRTNPLVDGGQVAGAGKNDIFTSVKWQLYANAMVELPWDMELAGAVFGKQGSPYPKFLRLRAGLDGRLQALAQPRVDVDRYDTVWDLDLRVAKTVRVGPTALVLSAELFNVFNSGVVLRRNGDASSDVFDRIDEILSPRILRVGARLTF